MFGLFVFFFVLSRPRGGGGELACVPLGPSHFLFSRHDAMEFCSHPEFAFFEDLEGSKSVPARQVSGGPFREKKDFRLQLLCWFKIWQAQPTPLRKRSRTLLSAPLTPRKASRQFRKQSTPSAVPRDSTRERREKRGERAPARRCRGGRGGGGKARREGEEKRETVARLSSLLAPPLHAFGSTPPHPPSSCKHARAHFPHSSNAQFCIKSSGVRIVCDLRRPVGERL